MLEKSEKLRRIQNTAVTLLVISGLINYLDRSTLSIANQSISVEMGFTASQMGLLLSAFSLAYAFAQLPVGVLLDRLGTRLVLGIGMLVWSIAQALAGLVQSMQQFLLARVLLGVGEAPQFPAGAKVVSEWFAVHERGRPTGFFTASTTVAPALAPPLLTGMMMAFGWRGMFVVMGVAGVAAAIGWYLIYRDRRTVRLDTTEVAYLDVGQESARQAAHEQPITFADFRALLSMRTTWGMLLGFMGVIYMVWLYLTWLPAYFERERGVSLASLGWVVAIPYLAGTLGMLSSGIVSDKLLARGFAPIVSRKWPVCIGLFFAAAFTVPAAYTPNLTMAVIYISGAMFFVNLASGGSWAMVSVAAPRRLVASLGGLKNFGGYLGGSAAPVITGMVVDATGSFVNALLISAAVSVTGALFYLFVVKNPIVDPASASQE